MQSEIRKIVGYDVEACKLDAKGREYLKDATNPGSLLSINGVLVVSSDNKTLNQDTIDTIEYFIKTSFVNYVKVRENDEIKS